MGETAVRVQYQECRTVVTKTDTLQRSVYWSIRRHEQFPVAVVIEMRADIERVWPLVNNLGSRITEDLSKILPLNIPQFNTTSSIPLRVTVFHRICSPGHLTKSLGFCSVSNVKFIQGVRHHTLKGSPRITVWLGQVSAAQRAVQSSVVCRHSASWAVDFPFFLFLHSSMAINAN